jgi:hypothetical protein
MKMGSCLNVSALSIRSHKHGTFEFLYNARRSLEMAKKEPNDQYIGAFVPANLIERLEAICVAEDRSRSQVIRRLLESALQTQKA